MKFKSILFSFMLIGVLAFAARNVNHYHSVSGKNTDGSFVNEDTVNKYTITRDTVNWIDRSRNRLIPVALYGVNHAKVKSAGKRKQKLVILNPGYGGRNTDYGYIADNLAAKGYFVVTIQHDLPSDPPIPSTGNIYESRIPFWNTGVKSVLFVVDQLKQKYPELDYKHLILIGHSNGGDIAMRIATQYPSLASIVISLDNRRARFPRASQPRLFSIRSSDQPADDQVLPSVEEQKKYQIKIVKVNTIHNDMGGAGTEKQKEEINALISSFLGEVKLSQ